MKLTQHVSLLIMLILLSNTIGLGQLSFDGSIVVDGVERTYLIHMPAETIEESAGLPLVFNLHGYTSNAAQQEFYSEMNATSDDNNFIVCYPEGIANSWNVGISGGSTADDVAFINALIEQFSVLYEIDTNRVYSCGMSNGGFMSYELACKIPDKIAAIASVTGSMVSNIDCDLNTLGTPVLQIHGTEDPVVQYAGSNGFMSIDDVIQFWIEKNGCIPNTTVIPLMDSDPDDGSTVDLVLHTMCNDDKDVVLFKVNGGGHTWPGSSFTILGVTNQDINASQEIWDFFSRFSLDGTSTSVNEIQMNELSISPNPAFDVINVNTEILDIKSITLLNSNGKQVAQSSTMIAFDVGHLPSGVYVVSVLTENKVITEKVIVQH